MKIKQILNSETNKMELRVINPYKEKNSSNPKLVWNKYDNLIEKIEIYISEEKYEHAMELATNTIGSLENVLYPKYKKVLDENKNGLFDKYSDYLETFYMFETRSIMLLEQSIAEIYKEVSKVF